MLLGGWSYRSDVGNTCCTLLPRGWLEWGLRQPACTVGLHSTATASTVSEVTTPQVLIAIHGLHTRFRISYVPHVIGVFNLLF